MLKLHTEKRCKGQKVDKNAVALENASYVDNIEETHQLESGHHQQVYFILLFYAFYDHYGFS